MVTSVAEIKIAETPSTGMRLSPSSSHSASEIRKWSSFGLPGHSSANL